MAAAFAWLYFPFPVRFQFLPLITDTGGFLNSAYLPTIYKPPKRAVPLSPGTRPRTPMYVSVSIFYAGRPTDQLTVTNSLRPVSDLLALTVCY
ncbi:hypothetical protein NDU88_003125 [Pleurodeles waltl]|uniref:Secreted protein n=1 Tax=Pleurodeles waltl TaxID=8319 RepID=A0AAV7Q960_PLEWA|nr:hypothetical protein NDU88_003125 [Pleurodeles waltl]